MKSNLFILLIFIPFFSFQQEINVSTTEATVSFEFVEKNVKGSLENVEASIALNPMNLIKSKISGSAQVSELNTENKKRDEHLKSDDFFNAEEFPKMTFTSEQIVVENDVYSTLGVLTIKETSKQVNFTISLEEENILLKTTIYATDFDVSPKKQREESKVNITVIVPLR